MRDKNRLGTRGKGMTEFFKSRGSERAYEAGRTKLDTIRAENARKNQDQNMAIARGVGKLGYFLGPEVGTVTENVFPALVDYWDKDAEKKFIRTDTGKWDASQQYEWSDMNEMLRDADKAQNWKALEDIGTSLFTYWDMTTGGKGSGNYQPFSYGGKDTVEGKGSVWDYFFNKESLV